MSQVDFDRRVNNQKLLKRRAVELETAIVDIFPDCSPEPLLDTIKNFFKDGDSDGYIYYVDDVALDVSESMGLFESDLADLSNDVNLSKYKEMILDVIGWNLCYHFLNSGSDESPFKELFAFNITSFVLGNWKKMGGVQINENIISTLIEYTSKQKHILFEKKKLLVKSDSYGFVNTSAWDKEKASYSSGLLSSLGIFSEEKDLFIFTRLISDRIIEMLVSESDSEIGSEYDYSKAVDQSAHHKGLEYEEDCIDLFMESGWTALDTPKSGDAGADIIATKRGLKVVVQCKNWAGNVGVSAIQEVVSAKDYYDADFSVLLTETGLTRQAQAVAEKLKVILITKSDIPELEVIILKKLI